MIPSRMKLVRWLRRGAAALGGLAVDAAVDSLELGKRCWGWLAHSGGARVAAVAALALVLVAGGAVWAAGARHRSEQVTRGELGDAP